VRLHAVADLLDELAPRSLAAEWDNSGWQIRLEDAELSGALFSLDAMPAIIDEARDIGANLLLTHHPLFFRPPRALDSEDLIGATALAALRAGLSVFTLHTNLDAAPGGTSWALAEALGLRGGPVLQPCLMPGSGYGVVARADAARSLADWAALAEERLSSAPLAMSGDPRSRHQTIAVMGGSGAAYLDQAFASGASLYLTADIRYHEAQRARAAGLSLIVLDHFASEQPVLERAAAFFRTRASCRVERSSRRTTPWEAVHR
jgi:dinuclear metal center YbgI/SA1388 family protein